MKLLSVKFVFKKRRSQQMFLGDCLVLLSLTASDSCFRMGGEGKKKKKKEVSLSFVFCPCDPISLESRDDTNGCCASLL